MKKNKEEVTAEKLAGLTILIQHSFLLTTEEKQTLTGAIQTMKPTDVDALGMFLAWEKQSALVCNEEVINLCT